jgi:hypothetical protein
MVLCGFSLLVTLFFMDNIKVESEDDESTKEIHFGKIITLPSLQ